MTKDNLSKIWTTVGLFTFYNSLNMYLFVQGSEIVLGFPDFSKASIDVIPLYSIGIFMPTFFILLVITKYYVNSVKKSLLWYKRLPIAFNLTLQSRQSSSKNYQLFFFIIFLVVPMILQTHSTIKFFETDIYTRDKIDGVHLPIATNFKEHLICFQDISISFKNEFMIGKPKEAGGTPMTFFPGYESWFILILQILLLIKFLLTMTEIFIVNSRIKKQIIHF